MSIDIDFTLAQRFVPVCDPLTPDLDGDGLETVGTAAGILFDHNGDGIKTGTGWVLPDDGFLALDRDGNGLIDSGRELFGDSTPLFDADGNEISKAADGFAALAQEDTNGDGVVDVGDTNWANLRVWQDVNQDGVSQSGELKTLVELGIVSLSVAKTEHMRVLPNGNVIADMGSFSRADGTQGQTGTAATMADIDLAADTFHRKFTDIIPLTEMAQKLPEMHGSGLVRDLRRATPVISVASWAA